MSSETRVMVSCRGGFSTCRRRELKKGSFNSAGSKVTPFCSSGCTGVNFRIDRLFSSRLLGRGIIHITRRGGMLLRRLCRGPLVGPSRLCGRLVRCGGVMRPFMTGMSLCLRRTVGRKGAILLRKRLKSVGSPSRKVCPVIASSSALTKCNTVKTKVPPCRVGRVIAMYGTCSDTMKTKTFMDRVFKRRTSRLEEHNNSNKRCNTAAKHPEEVK